MGMLDSFRDRITHRGVSIVALVTYGVALLAWVAVVGRWLPMPGGEAEAQMGCPIRGYRKRWHSRTGYPASSSIYSCGA